MKQHILFIISGGLGKNIMATAVARAIKKYYPNSHLIIATPHREVWMSNPRADEIISIDAPDMFAAYFHNKETLLFKHDPYFSEDWVYNRKHLSEIWCDLFKIPWDGEEPELYFTDTETGATKRLFAGDSRPIAMIQSHGGAPYQHLPLSWARDLPHSLVQTAVRFFNAQGYRVIHLRRHDQPHIKSTEFISMSHRQALCAIQFSSKRLFIDSFAAHAAAAFDLPSTVVWIVNSPKVYGYKTHTDITANVPDSFRHMVDSYIAPYDITGKAEESPFDGPDYVDIQAVLESLQ